MLVAVVPPAVATLSSLRYDHLWACLPMAVVIPSPGLGQVPYMAVCFRVFGSALVVLMWWIYQTSCSWKVRFWNGHD